MEYELKNEVLKNRGEVFKNNKHTNESLEKDVFQQPILTADEALKLGYMLCE